MDQVRPGVEVVGWYSIGDTPGPAHLTMHHQITQVSCAAWAFLFCQDFSQRQKTVFNTTFTTLVNFFWKHKDFCKLEARGWGTLRTIETNNEFILITTMLMKFEGNYLRVPSCPLLEHPLAPSIGWFKTHSVVLKPHRPHSVPLLGEWEPHTADVRPPMHRACQGLRDHCRCRQRWGN